MPRPNVFPPLRVTADIAKATIGQRSHEGADLFRNDRRYSAEMHDRFEKWYQETATDLERIFWSNDVGNWFRQGTCWLVGSGSYGGIIGTRDDRLQVLHEILQVIETTASGSAAATAEPDGYEVCLSFAGEQRAFVDEVADELRRAKVRVFYDGYEEVDLWGRDLYEHLNTIYRDRAQFCVMFISREYAAKQWTTLERKSAQARAFRQSSEYILPARFDDTELPGMNETIGYVDLRKTSPAKLAEMVVRKLSSARSRPAEPSLPNQDSTPDARASPAISLIAQWRRRDVSITTDRHDYRLLIDLFNAGKMVDEWRVQVWLPNAFLPGATEKSGETMFEAYDGDYSDRTKRLYPGDRINVLDVEYFVDHKNWPNDPFIPPERKRLLRLRVRVSADEMEPLEMEIPMADLQNF
ncbi:MAG TPA: TIR domain-containing protein [Thermoanaerobaculia bacterium]